jgi:hypothetical protein
MGCDGIALRVPRVPMESNRPWKTDRMCLRIKIYKIKIKKHMYSKYKVE